MCVPGRKFYVASFGATRLGAQGHRPTRLPALRVIAASFGAERSTPLPSVLRTSVRKSDVIGLAAVFSARSPRYALRSARTACRATRSYVLIQFREDLPDGGDARMEVRQLGFDANAIGAGKAVVATALHELQHFDRLDRRFRNELQQDSAVGGVD